MGELLERLQKLGFGTPSDQAPVFNDTTVSLVEAFQLSRGLAVTGSVDQATWQRLVEAGWQLGDRLLYLTKPYLRGDDVADLQVRLSQLGFNPGRIDGVFGPLLHDALSDFQRNCAIVVDGTLTRNTLRELRRVSTSSKDRTLVSDVRDITDGALQTGPVVIWGDSPLVAALGKQLAGSELPPPDWNVDEFADYVNRQAVAGVVAIDQRDDCDGIDLHYWSSYRSYSRHGERLASAVAAALSVAPVAIRLSISGMALPILRETRMTTIAIEHGPLDSDATHGITAAIATAVRAHFAN